MKLIHFVALPALALALNVHAECPAQFPTERPAIPQGRHASEADMQAASAAVQAYVTRGERYLACHRLSAERHNRYMDRISAIAGEFNGERAVYLGRSAFAGIVLGDDALDGVFIGREAVASTAR